MSTKEVIYTKRVIKKPLYYPVGKFKIHIKKLEEKQQLYMLYESSSAPVQDIPLRRISIELKNLIDMYLKETDNPFDEKFNETLYNTLSPEEKFYYHVIVFKSGNGIPLGYEKYEREDHFKNFLSNKLQLIQGALAAGNDNDLLINEACNILDRLKRAKYISKEQYRMLLKELL